MIVSMRALGVVVALLICGSIHVARADDADQLFSDGRALLETNPGEACGKFEKAQALKPDSVAIMLNLGVCKEKLKLLGSALRWYQKAASAAAGSKDPNAKDYKSAADDAVGKLAGQVAKVTIKLKPGVDTPDLKLFVNGRSVEKNSVAELDAGENTIEARQPGKITGVYKVTVKDGDQIEREIEPLRDAPKPPSTKNRKLFGIAVAGGSIAIASVIAGVWANGIQNDFIEANDNRLRDDAVDKMLKPTITFFAIAGVGTAVGAYFFFTKPKWNGQAEANVGVTAVAPVVTPDSGGLAVLGRF